MGSATLESERTDVRPDALRPAAVSISAAELDAARFGFHRAFPNRSAKHRFYAAQFIAIAALIAGLVWALQTAPMITLEALKLTARTLFAAAIVWRFIAAASSAPQRSRLADPSQWPTYTILCPLYREANVTPDLVAALGRLDYPGTE